MCYHHTCSKRANKITALFRAESHGYALYASCRNPMVNLFGRNFKATTTKFCTHVDEHGVQGCIDFHEHRLMASYILKTIKLNFRLNTVFTSLTKIHMVTSVTQTYIQSNKRQKCELNRSSSSKYNCIRQRVPV